jgi:hypothetical protein
MKEDLDYIRDIAEIRSMMERSSKFLSLSGWAGIMAGLYALAGAWMARQQFGYNPDEVFYTSAEMPGILILAVSVLLLSLVTAFFFSWKKAKSKGETAWNATSRRLLADMTIPLAAGGILSLILIAKGMAGLIAPVTLLFYGLALVNAGRYTIIEVKILGIAQMLLGLISAWFVEYSLLFWATGFGAAHIIYGIYMYFRYER